jgi:Anti-sigma-K factor rskA
MSEPRDLNELVGNDLTPEEEARLRRVHELLVEAGPPAELPPDLASYTEPRRRLPLLPRPRVLAGVAVGLAVVAATFGIGVLVGHRGGESFQTERVIPMRGTAAATHAIASIDLGAKDSGGNWPLVLHVTQLPTQLEGKYYELWLTRRGKLVASCGTFRVVDTTRTTDIRLNAPYTLKSFDGWVITNEHRKVLVTTV